MRFTVKIYKKHDMDLLAAAEQVNIINAMYLALKAFAKGEDCIIDLPPIKQGIPGSRDKIESKLILDEKKDADILEMLSYINPGAWNNFFKNVLRLYLRRPLAENFVNSNEGAVFFQNKLNQLNKGKRIIKTKERKSKPMHDSKNRNLIPKKQNPKNRNPIPKPQKELEENRNPIPEQLIPSPDEIPSPDFEEDEITAAFSELIN